MRVLITSSRGWTDESAIHRRLGQLLTTESNRNLNGHPEIVVVHGDCSSGGDRISRDWAVAMAAEPNPWPGVTHEPHPADWTGPCGLACDHGPRRTRRDGADYCPRAGFARDDRMVALGADICLAFGLRCAKSGLCRDRYGCRIPPGHLTHGTHDCASLALDVGMELRVWRQP